MHNSVVTKTMAVVQPVLFSLPSSSRSRRIIVIVVVWVKEVV